MKNKIFEIFVDTSHKIDKLKLINNGETSLTYFGYLNNKKSIFKILKKDSNKILKNNFYNKYVSTKIIKKNLFPKIIHSDKKNSLYVYEYFDGKQVNTLNKELIIKTAKKLKKLHTLDVDKKLITFNSQINFYIKEIKKNKNNKILKEGIKLYKKLKNNESDNVISHNDLNKSNILFNNHKICFIDYDYVSINNRFSDLARIFSSYKFTEKDINIFLEIYGLDNSKNNFHTIKNWQLMNLYTDSIWFYFLMENGLNKQNQNYLFLTEELIKQQLQ